jgi:hypothetical protein
VQPTHSKSVGILEWVAKENGNRKGHWKHPPILMIF